MQIGSARIVSQNVHIWKRFSHTRSFPYRWQKCIPHWFCKYLFKRKAIVNLKWFSQKGRCRQKRMINTGKILISSQFPNLSTYIFQLLFKIIHEIQVWVWERSNGKERYLYFYWQICGYVHILFKNFISKKARSVQKNQSKFKLLTRYKMDFLRYRRWSHSSIASSS